MAYIIYAKYSNKFVVLVVFYFIRAHNIFQSYQILDRSKLRLHKRRHLKTPIEGISECVTNRRRLSVFN